MSRSRTALLPLVALLALSACAGNRPAPVMSGMDSRFDGRSGGSTTAYRVSSGDTLNGIANRLGVDAQAIARLNRLQPPYRIYAGQPLLVPAGRKTATVGRNNNTDDARPLRPVQVATLSSPPPASAPDSSRYDAYPAAGPIPLPQPPFLPAPGFGNVNRELDRNEQNAPVAQPPGRAGGRFLWPVEGRIISGFGPKGKGQHNDGINIAVPVGTPVRAAENGVVVHAGNRLAGFGELLLLKHADGWITLYAHNSELLVKRGQKVTKGQVIAKSGQSGDVDSPQLHFEIRRGRTPVDPLRQLQLQRVSQVD